ncbi:MAG: NAD(P)/FAD-dependent oxidoreductase [Deltaproteobacteria bacterium]|nr:NAD(P)/FAD-dependent oxidoreductase [Deltaproteobacteria bacterium]
MSDAIVVIGGGVDGLVAATLLARRGRAVTLVEAREHLGGLRAREEFAAGFAAPGVLDDTAALSQAVVDALGLAGHGLTRRAAPAVWAPTRGGGGVVVEGERISGDLEAGDEARYAEHRAFIGRVRKVVRRLLESEAPDPLGPLWSLAGLGLAVRRLGDRDMIELLRIGPMCVADWMRDALGTERLRAALALPGVEAAFTGPWSAGSAACLLLREASAGLPVAGGPPALIDALGAAARAAGVTTRTASPVRRIVIGDRGAEAVELRDGERIEAAAVLSSLDPRTTLLGLCERRRVPDALADAAGHIRARGTTAVVRLALSAPLTDGGGRPVEALRTGDSLDAIERAFDAAKYRQMAERPALDVRQPSVADSSLAPPGHHVATILAHAAAWNLEGGWDDAARERLGDRVVAALAEVQPGVEAAITAREVLSPADLEARYGLSQGHLHHGEQALDQLLFLRPMRQAARHRTPIPGLWLTGPGTHPGPTSLGSAGLLAARGMLKSR